MITRRALTGLCLLSMVCSACDKSDTPPDASDFTPLEAGADLKADIGGDAKQPQPDTKLPPKPDATSPKPDAKLPPKPDQAVPADAYVLTDGAVKFPAVLDGVWLIGWSGGMHHFSWVRFSVGSPMSGKAQILSGKTLWSNAPFWNCSGATTWGVTAKPYTLQLHFPSGTCSGMKSSVYTFQSFKASGGWPKGAIMEADINQYSPSGTIKGYKFPASQCDAAMTTCKDPIK